MTVLERILQEAAPFLEDLTVVDGVIGLSFVGVKLSNGKCHFTYLMRECLPSGDLIFPYGCAMIGMPAKEVAQWAVSGEEDLQRGLGVAVLCATAPYHHFISQNCDEYYQGIRVGERVGLIGYMPPVINILRDKAEIICFDRAIEKQGTCEGVAVHPMAQQAELLPSCDHVIISGTAIINHTLDPLLELSAHAKTVLVSGFSLPFYPDAFADTPITSIGSARFPDHSDSLFKVISLGAGRDKLRELSRGQYCKLK